MESLNDRVIREPSTSLYFESWILLASRRRILDQSHPDYCGLGTFWLCDLRQFPHSLKKYLLSCCFVPGSVPCAGNKIMNKMKDLHLRSLIVSGAEGDTDKLFHLFGNSRFCHLCIKFCCSSWFGPSLDFSDIPQPHVRVSSSAITPGTIYC